MTRTKQVRVLGAAVVIAGLAIAGMLVNTPRGRADDRDDRDDDKDPRIEQGFDIAPVHLEFDREKRNLVGLGSYIVNAQGDCNGCHSTGPAAEFLPGGNPYFLHSTEQINPATYLGGGRDFPPISGLPSPRIISRNLTPDRTTGLPEGGNTFSQFREILREGTDFDHLHPNCSDAIKTNCFPAHPPFNGDLLQIMPWPIYKNMSDHDIRAIYEYLKAIPCIQGNYPGPNGLAQGIPPEPADRCK